MGRDETFQRLHEILTHFVKMRIAHVEIKAFFKDLLNVKIVK